jgi:2-oxoglutarate-Fe(II)-dependent dioxygenase family protein
MKHVHLDYRAPDEETNRLEAQLLQPGCYDLLVEDDTTVYKPDGSVLLIYRKAVIPIPVCIKAARVLRKAALPTKNRGVAVGIQPIDPTKEVRSGRLKTRRIMEDGKLSNTTESPSVLSGVVGAFDRNTRFPYCRLTAFTQKNWAQVQEALPLLQIATEVFREALPHRFKAQWDHIERTHAEYRLGGTAFTTLTVNKNWQTAVHKDAGDLKEGFGVMSAIRSGQFDGLYTVFPQFRVAVSMRTGGICLADVHEWHGNSPVTNTRENWERLSLVMYYRENMDRCGSLAEELERVKKRKGGALWDE